MIIDGRGILQFSLLTEACEAGTVCGGGLAMVAGEFNKQVLLNILAGAAGSG